MGKHDSDKPSSDQGWRPPPRVGRKRWEKPADQSQAEASLGELISVVDETMIGVPVTTAPMADLTWADIYRVTALMRSIAMAASILTLAKDREDEGIPILARTAIDVFLSGAYVRTFGMSGLEELYRDGWFRESRLRGRREIEPLTWPAHDQPVEFSPAEPTDTDKRWSDYVPKKLKGSAVIQADPVLLRAITLADEIFEWDSQLAVHSTFRALTGHMSTRPAGDRLNIPIEGVEPGEPLHEDTAIFTGHNRWLTSPTGQIHLTRDMLWWVAVWATEELVFRNAARRLNELAPPNPENYDRPA